MVPTSLYPLLMRQTTVWPWLENVVKLTPPMSPGLCPTATVAVSHPPVTLPCLTWLSHSVGAGS